MGIKPHLWLDCIPGLLFVILQTNLWKNLSIKKVIAIKLQKYYPKRVHIRYQNSSNNKLLPTSKMSEQSKRAKYPSYGEGVYIEFLTK